LPPPSPFLDMRRRVDDLFRFIPDFDMDVVFHFAGF
jgi:hypothetical protein